jgi:proline racemase
MYGGFITAPDDDGADFGVLFWHKDGFSTACGHGTLALGAWAVESGLVAPEPSGITEVTINVPSGRVRAQVHTD